MEKKREKNHQLFLEQFSKNKQLEILCHKLYFPVFFFLKTNKDKGGKRRKKKGKKKRKKEKEKKKKKKEKEKKKKREINQTVISKITRGLSNNCSSFTLSKRKRKKEEEREKKKGF